MLQVGPPAGNGHLDTILQSGDGKTGDHVERKVVYDEAMKDSGEVDAESPKGTAQKYDGQWKDM